MPLRQRHPSRTLQMLCLLVTAFAIAGCKTAPVQDDAASAPVDLDRFMGKWHVIAHVPYFGERGHVASSFTYTLQDDGDIAVRYEYREGFGEQLQARDARASVEEGSDNRLWTMWLLHVVPAKLRILEVAPDYSWALVEYPGRDLAWVYARNPVMDEAQYRELEGRIRGYGINTDKLRRVAQVREQAGKLGFAPAAKP
jgi:apolipoprotein D and lipocalin family protein